MTSPRRIGAPDAKNRVVLLDAAEQLLIEEGYAAVTSRRVADRAGLKAGDIIVALNGKPVTNPDALVVGIRALDVGDKVTLTVRRGGKDEDVTMVLEASTD